MHEFSLLADLLDKIHKVAAEQNAMSVTAVKVRIGALAHISADHFREHFEHATRDTIIELARLDIAASTDEAAPDAQDIVLESVEVQTS